MKIIVMDEQSYVYPVEDVEQIPGWGHRITIHWASAVPRVGDSILWPPNVDHAKSEMLVTYKPGHGPYVKEVTWSLNSDKEEVVYVIVGMRRPPKAEASDRQATKPSDNAGAGGKHE